MDNMRKAVEVLKNGGVVMHPTETCYGLAADVFSKKALDKLYRVKKMAADKPVSILVDSLGMAQEYGIFSDRAFDLAKQHWPGALSILVPRKKTLPEFFNPGHDYVSIRFSSDDFCTDMVSGLGRPVTTTSANIAGEPQLYKVENLDFVKKLDFVVDGGEISQNKPSTIVKVDGDKLELIRQGSVVVD